MSPGLCLSGESFGFSLRSGSPARSRTIRRTSLRDYRVVSSLRCSPKPNDPQDEPAGLIAGSLEPLLQFVASAERIFRNFAQ
jgi:hypothetical protein